eukprot:NODE_11282_length_1297_cov_1.523932.p1 GENE.NODE_11282_length_1297_cov_1.523932~~NODE_11282_length_1297_cov_1.523932.p1  ORF type:complete len:237 (+),score=58.23 NODE_11282_length_1297_cov_1.523932:444-1154(+)
MPADAVMLLRSYAGLALYHGRLLPRLDDQLARRHMVKSLQTADLVRLIAACSKLREGAAAVHAAVAELARRRPLLPRLQSVLRSTVDGSSTAGVPPSRVTSATARPDTNGTVAASASASRLPLQGALPSSFHVDVARAVHGVLRQRLGAGFLHARVSHEVPCLAFCIEIVVWRYGQPHRGRPGAARMRDAGAHAQRRPEDADLRRMTAVFITRTRYARRKKKKKKKKKKIWVGIVP